MCGIKFQLPDGSEISMAGPVTQYIGVGQNTSQVKGSQFYPGLSWQRTHNALHYQGTA